MEYCRVFLKRIDVSQKEYPGKNYDFEFGKDDAKINLYSTAERLILEGVIYKVVKKTLLTEPAWLLTLYLEKDE